MADGVLNQRLDSKERDLEAQDLRGDLQTHLDPVLESGLLEQHVPLHGGQLLLKGGEVTCTAQAVPGEVCEVDDELSRFDRVRGNGRGDGVEAVVDEVRRDLAAQGSQLCLDKLPPCGLGQSAVVHSIIGRRLDRRGIIRRRGSPAASGGDIEHQRGEHSDDDHQDHCRRARLLHPASLGTRRPF